MVPQPPRRLVPSPQTLRPKPKRYQPKRRIRVGPAANDNAAARRYGRRLGLVAIGLIAIAILAALALAV